MLWRSEAAPPIVGLVRITEIRVSPEVGGQLRSINVRKCDRVHAGVVVAELSALDLTASVAQACAALGAAAAFRDHIHAGVRTEEVDGLAVEIAKAKAKLEYAQQQLTRTAPLAQSDTATLQALDQAKTTWRPSVTMSPRHKRNAAHAQVRIWHTLSVDGSAAFAPAS